MAQREIPVTDPPPATISLPAACMAAVEAETVLSEMNLSRWAVSFDCSEEQIRAEFEKAQWKHTQKPVGFEGDGK